MKRHIYKLIIFILLNISLSLPTCFAKGRGTTGANFLKIDVGPDLWEWGVLLLL